MTKLERHKLLTCAELADTIRQVRDRPSFNTDDSNLEALLEFLAEDLVYIEIVARNLPEEVIKKMEALGSQDCLVLLK